MCSSSNKAYSVYVWALLKRPDGSERPEMEVLKVEAEGEPMARKAASVAYFGFKRRGYVRRFRVIGAAEAAAPRPIADGGDHD